MVQLYPFNYMRERNDIVSTTTPAYINIGKGCGGCDTCSTREVNGMEKDLTVYISRCNGMLKKIGGPLDGWVCEEVIDFEEAEYKCQLCGYPAVRYIHVMQHTEYAEKIKVGCICAGIMEGNILAAKERDNKEKRRSGRKSNFLKKKWDAINPNVWSLKYKNRLITIERNYFYKREFYIININGDQYHWKDNRRMDSFLTAQHYVFDLIDLEET